MGVKTVEQIYQKKSQHEHILTRPDMYIGTIEPVTDDIWVYDEADAIMKLRKCTWTPGLYKIFDEILVNAADNKVRDPLGQTTIKVWIEERSVRVFNNGEGIPVQKHREHNLWVPEMIFGHLLTSSNYDDNEAKVTGGRNGFGAKLTNVFSTSFEVETVHSRSRKKFCMKWSNNMLEHSEPVITPCEGPDYTLVTFFPDFAKFHVGHFSEDMILFMRRRVYDIAGCTDKTLKCYLNGERIGVVQFPQYVDLFPTMGEERHKHSYCRVNERWELAVRVSNIGFQQVSFVNSIATTRGGTHVKYILDQIIARVTEQAKKRNKTDVKPHQIKPHLFLFVNCLIENPGFDSQTKETLNTVRSKFGSSCDIPSSMIDYILRSGVVERSVEMANSKLTKDMATKLKGADRKQILGIPKLDDANEAGGKNSHRCTLIVTEGDSAKTLCTAGLAVKDRDYFGVFPLRGKPLNVRDASLKKVMQCEEIQNLMKIMGLDIRQKYTSVDGLRYGHLMIMSDQDHDGSHIKGLILNFIQFYWPSLLKISGFLQQFITPIVKARRKRAGNNEQALSFFSMPDYFEWKNSIGDDIANYDIRYYKGLGTSGSKEGREYFENIERHRLDFVGKEPGDEDRIVMAFTKDRVDERKEWITQYKTNENPNETMNYNVRTVGFGEFVDKELILFSIADCERSIPSAIDGFKPGHRKILFSCFKRNLVRSLKVVQLAGYVSEHSAYHHGEQSLVQTIVAMAQNFVGSNNIPLLQQDGQFGTRLQGGKDHAAGRYIFTRLAQITRCVFHPADDFVVEYKDDDGLSVEPFHYIPVIPMALVNGTTGIGTGFSTNIPSYSPLDIIDNLHRLIRGEEVVPMKPWYFGFTGAIEEREKGKFVSRGKYQIRADGVVAITELPVNVWTQNYKRFLEDLLEKEIVVQFREHNTDVTVDFEVFVHPHVLQQWVTHDLVEEKLQLREFIHATNIIAFNLDGQICKYLDAESLLKEFYLIRLDYYQRRKDYLLGELRRLTNKLENMFRFVSEVVDGHLIVTRRKKMELLEELRRRQYVPFPPHNRKRTTATTIETAEEVASPTAASPAEDLALFDLGGEEEESEEVGRATRDYDYLLGMKLWNLTTEMIDRLAEQLRKAKQDTESLEKLTVKELWVNDLDALRPKLESLYHDREKEIASIQRKKMEKKKAFDASRLRVPILSDKARALLQKDLGKLTAAARRPAAALSGDSLSITGDGTLATERPKPKRAPAKRLKRGSDSDDSVDESWLNDDGDSSCGGSIDGMGDDEGALTERQASRPATKRTPRAKKAAARGTTAPAVKKPAKPEGADTMLDLDGFGLDALGDCGTFKFEPAFPPSAVKVERPTPASSQAPPASHPTGLRFLDDEVEEATLLGLTSAKPVTAAAVAERPKRRVKAVAKPQQKVSLSVDRRKRRRQDSSESSEESSASESDSDDESSSEDTSSDASYDFSD